MTSQATRSISMRCVFGWFNANRFHYRYRGMHQCTSSVEARLLSTNSDNTVQCTPHYWVFQPYRGVSDHKVEFNTEELAKEKG